MAGGSGKRMNSSILKQFEIVHNKPILMHTFQTFFEYDPEIKFVLVLPENQFDYWITICKKYNFTIKHNLFYLILRFLASVIMESFLGARNENQYNQNKFFIKLST